MLPYSVAMQRKLYCTTWKYVEIELSQQAFTIKKKEIKNKTHNHTTQLTNYDEPTADGDYFC